jgi:vancomycin resistance protein YoaR
MTEREPGVDEGHENAAGAAGSPAADDVAQSGTADTGTGAERPTSSLSGDDLFAVPASPAVGSTVVSMLPGPAQPPAAPQPPAPAPAHVAADAAAADGSEHTAKPTDAAAAPVADTPAASVPADDSPAMPVPAADTPAAAVPAGDTPAAENSDTPAAENSAASVAENSAAAKPAVPDAEVGAERSESAAAWAGADRSHTESAADAGVGPGSAAVEPPVEGTPDVARPDVALPAGPAPVAPGAVPIAPPAVASAGSAAAGTDEPAAASREAAPAAPEVPAPARTDVPAEPAAPEPAVEPTSAATAAEVREPAGTREPAEAREPARPDAARPEPARPEAARPEPARPEPAEAPAAQAPAPGAPGDRQHGWFDPARDTETTAVLPAVRPAKPATPDEPRSRQAAAVDPATVRIPARRTEQPVERPTEVIPAIAAETPRREAVRRPDQAEAPTTLTKAPAAAAAAAAAAAGATAVLGAAAAAGRPTDAGPTTTMRAGGTAGAAGEGATAPAGPGAAATRPVGPDADSGGDGPDGPDAPEAGATGRRRRKPLLVAAAVVGLLAVLYVVDLLLGMGDMPRGVSVAGQAVGGMSREEAEASLRATIDPRSTQPIVVTAGDVRTEIDADTAKLGVDWGATIERAGAQPLNPITRVQSFFVDKDFDVVSTADERAVAAALEGMGPLVDDEATEASVRFDGLEPVPVMPEDGHRLDVPAAVPLVSTKWATGQPVELPLVTMKPVTTADDVRQAVDSIARPAVSAPITVTGEGAQGTLDPAEIAKALTFRADAAVNPRLVPELNPEVVSDALSPQLAKTEKPGRDATLDVSGPTPVVVPSQDGRGIDYPATLTTMMPVLTAPAPRQVAAVYGDKPAKVTTEDIEKLGIAGEISTFTTGGFAADSGRNIRRAAEQIDGTIVKPGETFSLNAKTNPRNAANGYVEAGIIEDGHPARGIGGGVSQVATTLYNAAYFAGMVDVAHKEHSFYISRYPVAREATVFDNVIDLKFRNDGPTGVLIKTFWTPSSLTVKIYGTKRYEVTSTTGPRTNETSPSSVTIPAGQPCSASSGAPGFTATDTRTLRNVQTGEVRTERRTVRYNPSPIVVCGG